MHVLQAEDIHHTAQIKYQHEVNRLIHVNLYFPYRLFENGRIAFTMYFRFFVVYILQPPGYMCGVCCAKPWDIFELSLSD